MAELLSLLTTSLTIISNTLRLRSCLRRPQGSSSSLLATLPFISRTDHTYATHRFPNHPVLAALLLDVRGMRKLEDEIINSPSPRTVMAFKDSHLAAVGGTGVASAILAQLSMTTLQLDGLSDIHWSAAGFILSSLLFGVLSVMVATMQQQAFGMLNDDRGVRLWLSCGYYEDKGDYRGWKPRQSMPLARKDHRSRRMKASVASLQIMRLPNTFLSFAAVAFLVGIGLFLGFAARQDLDRTPARDNNKAVLALWVTVGSVCVLECAGSSLWKVSEGRKLEEQGKEEEEEEYDQDEEGGRAPGGKDRPFEDDDDSSDETTSLMKRPKQDRGSHISTSAKAQTDGGSKDPLVRALEESARAHLRAAEADREVARLLQAHSR